LNWIIATHLIIILTITPTLIYGRSSASTSRRSTPAAPTEREAAESGRLTGIARHAELGRSSIGRVKRWLRAFDFRRQIALVKFMGTHAEYDRIDVLTASLF
jgi:hypothetical protein